MKLTFTMLGSLIAATLFISCSNHPPAPSSSSQGELDGFKQALIAYLDAHPGFFIGRANSEGLGKKPLVVLESPQAEPRYALEEFVIVPSKMRFEANYGIQGPEPYCYEGEFTNSANGTLQVGAVKLTRFHVRPQPKD